MCYCIGGDTGRIFNLSSMLHGVPYGRYILLCLIRWAIQGICLTSCALIKGKISQFDREIQLENEVKYLSL